MKIDSYDKYFEYLGLGKVDETTLNEKLKQAVANSRRKKYHGTEDEILTLPSGEEQLRQLQEKIPKFQDFFDKETKTLKNKTEDEWKKACLDRWIWIKEVYENAQETKPFTVAVMSDTRM